MSSVPSPSISRVLRLALPMAGSRLIQMLNGFIGMLMIARLGKNVLAAGALMSSANVLILMVLISLLFSMSVVTGKTYGAQKHNEMAPLLQQGCLLAVLLGVVMIMMYQYADQLLLWARQPERLVHYVREFFHAMRWGAIGIMLVACIQQFCYAIMRQRLVILANLFCLMIFIPLAYCLIYGVLGIPKLGVTGLGYAISIQAWINFIILLTCLHALPHFKQYHLFKIRFNHGLTYLLKLLQIGWPISVQIGGELLAFFVTSLFVGWLGANALAASQITQQIVFLIIVPIFAVAESSGILVSQEMGAVQYQNVRKVAHISFAIVMSFIVVVAICFILFSTQFAGIYLGSASSANPQILWLTHWLFVISAFTLAFDAFRNMLTGALRGLYDTQYSMWTGILTVWIFSIPMAYVAGFVAHWGVLGIRAVITIGFMLSSAILWRRWQHRTRNFLQQ